MLIPVKLPWMFLTAPLTFNEVPGNIQGNLTGIRLICRHPTGATVCHTGLILGLRPANERRRYKVTPSQIGWAQTKN